MEDRAGVEKEKSFGTDFCRQASHQFLGFDPTGGDGRGACAFEGSLIRLVRMNAWVPTVEKGLVERERVLGIRKRCVQTLTGRRDSLPWRK